ncbi:hypothetical protein O1611_g8486 [Lasiodiplodia mahajangana]|uniref:Uncharacterized protein n=1 Tax=Lasiodiplodia mahajangana TaxID=1108764 RepID=A0ACC2JCR1_9PEZI|nr:hypothetical protein O1611_g8486 [Lasiodiplodia mahajangana]
MCFTEIIEPKDAPPKTNLVGLLKVGFSSLNPKGRLNNCVSVSIAKFLGFPNDHELWRTTLGCSLRDEALNVIQVAEFIKRAGYGLHCDFYQYSRGHSAYENLLRDLEILPFQMVAYVPRQGQGHCVLRVPGKGYKFVCYQRQDDGIDFTTEVQQAKLIWVFCLSAPYDSPPYQGWLSRVLSNKTDLITMGQKYCVLVESTMLKRYTQCPFFSSSLSTSGRKAPPPSTTGVAPILPTSVVPIKPTRMPPRLTGTTQLMFDSQPRVAPKSSVIVRPEASQQSPFRVQPFKKPTAMTAVASATLTAQSLSLRTQVNPAWVAACYMPALDRLTSSGEKERRELFNQRRLSSMVESCAQRTQPLKRPVDPNEL